MADVLIYGDTIRSPELRHEVPVDIGDPFVYVERNGSRRVFVGSLEIPRLRGLDGLELTPLEAIGFDELAVSGLSFAEIELELVLRACREAGVEEALVPRGFPVATADHLRENGITISAEGEFFERRRRAKTRAEVDGIRRAQRGCERALDELRRGLREEERPTCEDLRARVLAAFSDAGLLLVGLPIVSHGAQTAVGHETGSGPIAPGEPVVVDLFPHDPRSGCYADMTRTFCLGEPPPELVEYHRLCREALDLVYPEIRPGVRGVDLYALVCDLFERNGYATQRTKQPGETLENGFFHSLGHGVGLEVHEQPALGRSGNLELVAGDVLAVEPGLYRSGFGGCRLEDLVLVTEDGCERLVDYPYDLAP